MNDLKCFIIMPFSVRENDLLKYSNDKNHWNEVYHGLIVPSIINAGMQYERDDEDLASRLITENIWRKIEEADVVLCDLSAFNPNVYLELGWALRSDKKFVLIKDGITDFNFDLNQYYTYEYSHYLQPTAVSRSVQELSVIIKKTISDSDRRYSIVNKLSLQERVNKAANEGNIEVSILKELLSEVRAGRNSEYTRFKTYKQKSITLPRIETRDDLIRMLSGSTWRKKNDLEHIIFQDDNVFFNNLAGHPSWRENKYYTGRDIDEIKLIWSIDGYESLCLFRNGFSEIVELANPEECIWYIVSSEPYL
jgi:hypothetical protein